MKNRRVPLSRLTPVQLLVVLALLVLYGLYQAYLQNQAPAAEVATSAAPATLEIASLTPAAPSPLPAQAQRSATPAQAAAASPSPRPATRTATARTADFDFYVLALSWSPDYCATNNNDDPQQCAIGKKLGFVLHGLWPQYNQGYPSDCKGEFLSNAIKAQFPGLYPSDSLMDHEWLKHGTCSGLSPSAYLAFSRQLKESVAIPAAYLAPQTPFRSSVDELKKAFVQSNSSMPADGLAVMCSGSGRYLQELRVCFTIEGRPRACSAEVLKDAQKSCQNADFQVRNTR